MLKEGSWGQHYEVTAAAAYFQSCIEVQQPQRPVEVAFYGRQEHTQFFWKNASEMHFEWMRPA